MAPPDSHLVAVILAGGVGSRFWPASTPARPKQLLPLASDRPLIVDTVERALALVPAERLRILTSEALADAFRPLLSGPPDSAYWIEPRARGTGPVLAWAAHRIVRADPEGVMVSLHADHAITPTSALVSLVTEAARAAADQQLLLTIGIPPDRPETGYGWILPATPLDTRGPLSIRRVGEFREKPDLETAKRYMERGDLWNSGIFLWKARTFLEEVARLSPEIGPHLHHLDRGDDPAFFDAVERISVDEAVLERSDRVAVVDATFEWDDVGSWDSLPRAHPPDGDGNAAHGPAYPIDAHRNLIWTEEGPVILWEVDDLVVIRSGGVTVVAPRDRSPDWKMLLDRIPDELRAQVDRPPEDE